MSDFAKMDIFFVVTTFVVVAIAVLIALILFRIWRILGHVEAISRAVSQEGELLRVDIAEFRKEVGKEGFKLLGFVSLIRKAVQRFFRIKRDN